MSRLQQLTHVSAHAGAVVATGASAFIPIPLLDDWVTAMSRKMLVATVVRKHGRQFPVRHVKPLYDDGSALWSLPFRLAKSAVLTPVRVVLRNVLLVFAVRAGVLAMGKTLAIGHTLDRALAYGAFRDDATPAERRHEARRLRRALDAALAGIDRRLLTKAVQAMRRKGDVGDTEGFLAEIDRRVDQHLAGIARE